MKNPNPAHVESGQALAEMILSIPLLLLFAAGLIQFSILFLSYVQFEHACGEAARLYAAQSIDKNSLGPKIAENLGVFRPYFDQGTLTINVQEPKSSSADILEKVTNSISSIPFIGKWAINYGGAEWVVLVRFKPPFLLTPVFPSGVPFQTTMQIYRYPQ